MSLAPLTLDTNVLTTGVIVDPQSFVEVVYAKGTPKYTRDQVNQIANSLEKWNRVFAMDGRYVGGQILEETGFLQFGHDVKPEQFNLAGLGATGGVPGLSFDTLDEGVLAVYAHNNIYWRGTKEHWDVSLQPYYNASKRYTNVVSAGKAGIIHRIGDLGNGNWAEAGDTYPREIVARGNLLRAKGDTAPVAPLKIAVGAGHHNTDGGNAREIAMTGPLTKAYVDIGRQMGFDVRCYTPNDGLGQFPGKLGPAAHQVVDWANQGWVADYFLENHFQGLNAGSDAGRGFFCIYPDWDSDVDVDVRDVFSAIWVPTFEAGTGLPRYGNGTMSEKRTAVGASGYRLGIFGATVDIKASTTRLIIEHGCHTCPSDYAIIQQGQPFYEKCARAFFSTLQLLHGINQPPPQPADPPAPYVPTGPGFSVNGFYLVGPFAQAWSDMGKKALPMMGQVTSGMILAPIDGHMRYVQFTEKGALACYPPELPDGVQPDSEWFIRGVFASEREEALTYAKQQGLVAQDLR